MHAHTRISAIILRANQVLLVRKNTEKDSHWLFPGDQIKTDLLTKTSINDQIKNQLGLTITKTLQECEFFDEPEKLHHKYIVCEVDDSFPVCEDEVRWFNISDALLLPKLYPIAVKDHLKFLHENLHENKK